MKTLPSLILVTAFVTLATFPVSFEFAASLLLFAGLTSVFVADYSRKLRVRTVSLAAPSHVAGPNRRSTTAFPLAA